MVGRDGGEIQSAIVLKIEPTEGRFTCWILKKQLLKRCELSDPLEVGCWINLKMNENGIVESYSEILEVFDARADEEFIQVRCVAYAPPEEYAEQHKKKGFVYNPILGWAFTLDPQKKAAVKMLHDVPLTAMYCCVRKDDNFRNLLQKKHTVWYLSDFQEEVDEIVPETDFTQLPWKLDRLESDAGAMDDPANNNVQDSLLCAPYVTVIADKPPVEGERLDYSKLMGPAQYLIPTVAKEEKLSQEELDALKNGADVNAVSSSLHNLNLVQQFSDEEGDIYEEWHNGNLIVPPNSAAARDNAEKNYTDQLFSVLRELEERGDPYEHVSQARHGKYAYSGGEDVSKD